MPLEVNQTVLNREMMEGVGWELRTSPGISWEVAMVAVVPAGGSVSQLGPR